MTYFNNYDGLFSGESDKSDGAGSYFGHEFYNGRFAPGEVAEKQKRTDHGIFFFETSLFEVTNAEGEHNCKVEYEVDGEKLEEQRFRRLYWRLRRQKLSLPIFKQSPAERYKK